jgi:hypothetical protein
MEFSFFSLGVHILSRCVCLILILVFLSYYGLILYEGWQDTEFEVTVSLLYLAVGFSTHKPTH